MRSIKKVFGLKQLLILNYSLLILTSCSITKQISKSAIETVIKDSSLINAHIGISIFDPATGKYWYNYNGEKYFVPASNTKLPTCYAAMKYLGDSLVGARIAVAKDSALEIYPSADPTFLNSEFQNQPLLNILKEFKTIRWDITGWKSQQWGNGWSWNDYDASYMAERSPLPMYGNLISFSISKNTLKFVPKRISINYDTIIGYNSNSHQVNTSKFDIQRSLDENEFYLRKSNSNFTQTFIPFRTRISFITDLLEDTLKSDNVSSFSIAEGYMYNIQKKIIHSQPTDSVLKPMMQRSDNFFAEQSLLMVSNELLGVMNDEKIIDTLLKTDFKDLPQKPRWADGSGLSRYNLFTPQDFVAILNKMKNEFGMDRIKVILPTGGEGTISNYYKTDSGYIYAKTGTLSGVVALSGFLTTRKGKQLLFSVLVNNHRASTTTVRKAVEQFIQKIRQQY